MQGRKKGFLRIVSVCLVSLLLFATSAFAQTTIVFQYRVNDQARQDVVNAWIAEFERQNPGIKVELLPAGSDYRERTLIQWASGTGPDVIELWGDWAQDYARAGTLLDLRPYVERDFTAEDIADFFPAAWEAATVRFGPSAGEIFRIPRYVITVVVYYNEELFQRAGLPTPMQYEAAGEWTFDTLRELARRLTIRNGDIVQQWGFTTDTDDYNRRTAWVRAFGGEWFDPNNPYNFTGDEGGAVEALSFLQEMIWVDGSTHPEYITDDFRAGTVAMAEDGIHAVLSRYDATIAGSFPWNIAPAPVGPNGRKAYTGDDGFAIWRNTPNAEAAWKFVKFLTSKEGQEINIAIEGLAPSRRSAFPAYQLLTDRYNLNVLLTNMADGGVPMLATVPGNIKAIADTLVAVLDRVMERNEVPYAQAIREVAETIETYARQ